MAQYSFEVCTENYSHVIKAENILDAVKKFIEFNTYKIKLEDIISVDNIDLLTSQDFSDIFI